MRMAARPDPSEYASFYETYISLVPDGPIAETLTAQSAETMAFYHSIGEEASARRYAPGKWSIKQVLGHMMDSERIFTYRILCIARGETQSLPGFDQDTYVATANFDDWRWTDLLDDFAVVRASTIRLLRSLTPEMLARRGVANKVEVTANAITFILAGHELHHVRCLKRDYLKEQTAGAGA
jgi:uncharacterized damage-inducible protein DinB